MSGRINGSPYTYDRAEVRRVLETDGMAEARMRFPVSVVRPIARALGLLPKYRPNNSWNPEWNSRLGTESDYSLSGELGVPSPTVKLHRRQLGIPTFSRSLHKAAKLVRSAAALAAQSDTELLRNLGLIAYETKATHQEIKAERTRRGLFHARYQRFHSAAHEKLQRLRMVCIRAMRRTYPAITLEELGAVLGVTRERVRQIEETDVRQSALVQSMEGSR